ncbi:MAG: hypothetical protein KIH69_023435 [Anaerolineae bacterium]|nr:hypothetical protein [Anaerolineae bacterium]
MSVAEKIVECVNVLSEDKQQQLLAFAEFLRLYQSSTGTKTSTSTVRSMFGAWSDVASNITLEDITEMRREMWQGFPRGM